MKAVIFGVQGETLTPEEAVFFKETQPLGFILFRRNCRSPQQIKNLIEALRSTVQHTEVPILIDQEGGRVTRLRPPHFREAPPAKIFGDIYSQNDAAAKTLAFQNYSLIAQELSSLGINANCAPCVDLFQEGADTIIGDRAFSGDVDVVVALSAKACEAHLACGVMPIVKHLPGHGRAAVDSHEKLPTLDTSKTELDTTDFRAFRGTLAQLSSTSAVWGMTAHIIYAAYDPVFVATESHIVIHDVIRQQIGFNGFLVSDCLTMNALQGAYSQRAQRAHAAGCDATLFCNGVLADMKEMITGVPELSGASFQRFQESAFLFNKNTPVADAQPQFQDAAVQWVQDIADFYCPWESKESVIGEKNK